MSGVLGVMKNIRGKNRNKNKWDGITLGDAFGSDYESHVPSSPSNGSNASSSVRMRRGRRAGIVLHPTSLPGPLGCGDLGQEAYHFVDWLASAGIRCWQVLPLVPPERAFWSPYAGENANAGNTLLISLQTLVQDGLLEAEELNQATKLGGDGGGQSKGSGYGCDADFELAVRVKEPLLSVAAQRLVAQGSGGSLGEDFDTFCTSNDDWLGPAALFHCIGGREELRGQPWWQWPPALRDRDPDAMVECSERHKGGVMEFKALQFLFDRQWGKLRRHANEKGISIVGDMPIYIGGNSADVWANRDLFELDKQSGRANHVSGVPPDAFSETGQLWGNPLYDWKAQRKDGYKWWTRRLERAFNLYDEARIDHFRGFAGYWSVEAHRDTAMVGVWRAGPGMELFNAMMDKLGEDKVQNIMAEDLGVITQDVVALRESLGAPGMLVLQFAFDGNPGNPHLPHNHYVNCFVYPGTHDNDTTVGWYQSLDTGSKEYLHSYLGSSFNSDDDVAWTLVRAAMLSVAHTAMFTMQDVLALDNSARMNLPGTAEGNWAWRMSPRSRGARTKEYAWADLAPVAARLKKLTQMYGREGSSPNH